MRQKWSGVRCNIIKILINFLLHSQPTTLIHVYAVKTEWNISWRKTMRRAMKGDAKYNNKKPARGKICSKKSNGDDECGSKMCKNFPKYVERVLLLG